MTKKKDESAEPVTKFVGIGGTEELKVSAEKVPASEAEKTDKSEEDK